MAHYIPSSEAEKREMLDALGMKDVMEFGMWRWLCYPLVWVLNLFHSWIPSFGLRHTMPSSLSA